MDRERIMDALDPNNAFGYSIFGFFLLAVLTFFFVAWKFMNQTGGKTKGGERFIMWMSVVGVIVVLAYAILAFIFKIII